MKLLKIYLFGLVFFLPVLLQAELITVHFVINPRTGLPPDPFRGEILSVKKNVIVFKHKLKNVRAYTKKKVRKKFISHIEFNKTIEDMAYDKMSLFELKLLWQKFKDIIDIEGSHSSAVGLELAKKFRVTKNEKAINSAIAIYDAVEKNALENIYKATARQERLQTYILSGRAEESIEEARLIEKESEDPSVIIFAKFILAKADFQKLKDLVKENPRWYLDDYIKPKRDRLFNSSIDLFLYPYLFFGAYDEELSARGIWHALEVYDEAKEMDKAIGLAEDIVALYPTTTFVEKAKEFLAKNSKEKNFFDEKGLDSNESTLDDYQEDESS